MNGRYRPTRRFRNELVSLGLAIVAPVSLVAVFPIGALRPDWHESVGTNPSCAFIELSPDEERAALAAARASWQLDRGSAHRLRVDLLADSLPAMPPRSVLDIASRQRINRCALGPYAPDLLPPTLALPPPVVIAPQPDTDKIVPAFSREELLKLK